MAMARKSVLLLFPIPASRPSALQVEQKQESGLHVPQRLCLKNFHLSSAEKIQTLFLRIAISTKPSKLPSTVPSATREKSVCAAHAFLSSEASTKNSKKHF